MYKISKTIVCSLLIILTLLCYFNVPAAAGSGETDFMKAHPEIINEFRDLVDNEMKAGGITGLSVALVDDENILWSEGFGYTDRDMKTPVNGDTIFAIQSMSKSVTATAVMEAVQDGILDLDRPISYYLPGFTVNSIFEEHPENKITLRHLLSHTAGFTHEAPVGSNYDANADSFEEHIKSISKTWLRFPVGKDYAYSNLGIDLAGYILQKVSGKSFQQYVDEKLVKPAGMVNSTFDMSKIKDNQNRAIGQSSINWKMPLEIPMIPAGGFYSSANDMARYIQFHIKNRDMLGEMYKVPFPVPGQTEGYGLGVVTYKRFNTYYINHNGGGFGFTSTMIWYPELKVGVVVLTNSTDAPEEYSSPFDLGQAILDKVVNDTTTPYYSRLKEISSDKYPSSNVTNPDMTNKLMADVSKGLMDAKDKPEPDEASWNNYTGEYIQKTYGVPFAAGMFTISEKSGSLFLNNMKLTEVKPGLFFTNEGEALDMRGKTPLYRDIPLSKLRFGLVFYGIILGLCALLFLTAAVLWPLGSLIRFIRRKRKGTVKEKQGLKTIAKIFLGVDSGLLLILAGVLALFAAVLGKFSAGAALSLAQYGNLRFAIGFIKLASPFVLLFVPVVLFFNILVWRSKYWSAAKRVYYSCVTVFGVLFVILMYNFNLILI